MGMSIKHTSCNDDKTLSALRTYRQSTLPGLGSNVRQHMRYKAHEKIRSWYSEMYNQLYNQLHGIVSEIMTTFNHVPYLSRQE